jgi:hypothetical protein
MRLSIVAKMRLFLAGGRFYALIATSPAGVDDPAVDAFLTSFRLTAKAPASGNASSNAPG